MYTYEGNKISKFYFSFTSVYFRVLAYPEQPPAIDWSFYKAKVPVAGMVDDFQKQYSALKVPYPPDTVKPQLDAYEQEIKSSITQFKSESNERIEGYVNSLLKNL